MRHIICSLTLVAAVMAALPAPAELKHYRILADEFTNTPGASPPFVLKPDQRAGQAIIRDTGDGTPVLVNLRVHTPFEENAFNTEPFTMLPGSLSFSRSSRTDQAGPNHAGTGSSSATIDWGMLTGWTGTGLLFCQESPASLLNTLCPCAGWASGITITPVPSRAVAYDTGVWTFSPDMTSFNGAKFLYATFVGGSNNQQWKLKGELAQIPALPLLGAAALGTALTYLGVRAVRGSRE